MSSKKTVVLTVRFTAIAIVDALVPNELLYLDLPHEGAEICNLNGHPCGHLEEYETIDMSISDFSEDEPVDCDEDRC